MDDLLAQLLLGPQRHVGHGHALQIGDVLFEVAQRFLDLQGDQPSQALPVDRLRLLGLVEHLDAHTAALVHQGRETHQNLSLATDLHQLRQLGKVPNRVQAVLCRCLACRPRQVAMPLRVRWRGLGHWHRGGLGRRCSGRRHQTGL